MQQRTGNISPYTGRREDSTICCKDWYSIAFLQKAKMAQYYNIFIYYLSNPNRISSLQPLDLSRNSDAYENTKKKLFDSTEGPFDPKVLQLPFLVLAPQRTHSPGRQLLK